MLPLELRTEELTVREFEKKSGQSKIINSKIMDADSVTKKDLPEHYISPFGNMAIQMADTCA